MGIFLETNITKAAYDAFIARKRIKGIESKLTAEVLAKIEKQKEKLLAAKQLLAKKNEEAGDEWELVDKVGRPSRPDFYYFDCSYTKYARSNCRTCTYCDSASPCASAARKLFGYNTQCR